MPLSPAAPRKLLHRRGIEILGFEREDGLWDIEARLVDTKTYAFANHDRGGTIEAGEPLHEMLMRVTIDADMLIHRIEAVIDHAPFHICDTIAPAFADLAGLRIGKGFLAEVRRRHAGIAGCTHLVELFGPIATTAYQTLSTHRERQAARSETGTRPATVGRCHAMAPGSPVVGRLWPNG